MHRWQVADICYSQFKIQNQMEGKNVLAIQSHVVHGYVGNKAAMFPLQLRGWDVDAMNAVQFSNHTGYGEFHGQCLDGEQIKEIYKGIKAQNFPYDALLTGYLPSASVLDAVHRIGADMKARNKDYIWLLDPVMGDEGKLYVKDDVVPAYKSVLKAEDLVTIITPNHFEAELLTGITLDSSQSVVKAIRALHTEFGIPHVVISSWPHPTNKNLLLTVGSSAKRGANGQYTALGAPFVIEQTKINTYFTGTGDLFAALLLDNYQRLGPEKLAEATAITISIHRRVLDRTWEYSRKHHNSPVRMSDPAIKFQELRLVQAVEELRSNYISEDVQIKTFA